MMHRAPELAGDDDCERPGRAEGQRGEEDRRVKPPFAQLEPEEEVGGGHQRRRDEQAERPRRALRAVDQLRQRAGEDPPEAVAHGEEGDGDSGPPVPQRLAHLVD